MTGLVNCASSTGEWKGTRATLTKFGVVRKPFRFGDKLMRVGDTLSPEQCAALRRDNLLALVENRFLEMHALSAELQPQPKG
jgi:hypothetical protein